MERPTTFNTATGMGVNFSIPVSNITGKRGFNLQKFTFQLLLEGNPFLHFSAQSISQKAIKSGTVVWVLCNLVSWYPGMIMWRKVSTSHTVIEQPH